MIQPHKLHNVNFSLVCVEVDTAENLFTHTATTTTQKACTQLNSMELHGTVLLLVFSKTIVVKKVTC